MEIVIYPDMPVEQAINMMNAITDEAFRKSALGETGWICSDCCMCHAEGMPESCFHGHEGCTKILQRDIMAAKNGTWSTRHENQA